jgi:hypothetical protein
MDFFPVKAVATVDGGGLVTGVSEGTVIIAYTQLLTTDVRQRIRIGRR